jgi:dTDP-glucose pyrophosphorylase
MGNYVVCIEEKSYKSGWITDEEYQQLERTLEKTLWQVHSLKM